MRKKHKIPNNEEDWVNSRWRPTMAWVYICICLFDFIIAPILWSLLQAHSKGVVTSQWQPLTLQGAGLFHVAMGAVLGITAYGRTQEKINGMPMYYQNNMYPQFGGMQSPYQGFNQSQFGQQQFNQPQFTQPQFGQVPTTSGFNGKQGPIQPTQPEL